MATNPKLQKGHFPDSSLGPVSTVSNLIDDGFRTWKADLIKHEFLPHEANIIAGLPLSLNQIPDLQTWFPSSQGNYTTRSAYQMLAKSDRSLVPNCSNLGRNKRMWSGIWCLLVPHKVKHMLWRATHEAIPTLLNLWKRKVVSSVTCPRCLLACEDSIHSLWSCPALRVIWEAIAAGQRLLKYRFMTFADLMETVVEMKDCFNINLVAMILWMIWECRNSDRVGGCSTDLRTIRVKALTFLHDFSSAQIPRQVQLSVSGSNSRWIPPNPLTYKVNFDGAIFKELGAAGLGMVIRDFEGLVIGTLAERIPLPCSVATVEALACRRAVLFVKEMSIFEATVEGDAEIVISDLKDGRTSNSEFGHIIQDSLVLANELRFCVFSHVKRLGNTVVHYLARKAKSGNEL